MDILQIHIMTNKKIKIDIRNNNFLKIKRIEFICGEKQMGGLTDK